MKQNEKIRLIILFIIFIISVGALYWFMNYDNSSSTSNTATTTETPTALSNLNVKYASFSGFYPNTQFDPPAISVNMSLYQGLTAINKNFRLEPQIAQKWDNPDKNTWRFYLNPSAKFSNGNKITTSDVKFSYDTFVASQNPLLQSSFQSLKEVKIINDSTIDFITSEPDAVLANKLAYLLIISNEQTTAGDEKVYIGSGPYVIDSFEKDKTLVLKQNTNYWKTKPYVRKVSFISDESQTETEKVQSVINGKIDIANIGNEQGSLTLAKQNNLQVLKKSGTTVYNLFINTVSKSIPEKLSTIDNPLAKEDVREAIYTAINPKTLVANIPAGANAESQLVNQYIVGYNKDIKRPTYSVEQAKQLLKTAGYENGFTLTIDVVGESNPAVASVINDLAAIGISAKMNIVSPENTQSTYDGSSAMSLQAYQPETGESGTVLNNLIHTPTKTLGGLNTNGYSNTQVDSLIDQANQTLKAQDRLQLLKQAMQTVMSDVARIPLYSTNNVYAVNKNILWEPRLDEAFLPAEVAGKAQN